MVTRRPGAGKENVRAGCLESSCDVYLYTIDLHENSKVREVVTSACRSHVGRVYHSTASSGPRAIVCGSRRLENDYNKNCEHNS